MANSIVCASGVGTPASSCQHIIISMPYSGGWQYIAAHLASSLLPARLRQPFFSAQTDSSQARTEVYSFFQLMAHIADERVKKSNKGHKSFIDTLTEAYRILNRGREMKSGGDEYRARRKEDVDKLLRNNRFSLLDRQDAATDDDAGQLTHDALSHPKHKRSKRAKGKRGKGGNRGKRDKFEVAMAEAAKIPFTVTAGLTRTSTRWLPCPS